MVFLDDFIHIYVDFLPIVATTSLDDALALLIAMYTIFELNFPKNSRTIRLLYSVLHCDRRFLSNTIRLFIKEKQINIDDEPYRTQSVISNINSDKSTVIAASPQSLAQKEILCSSISSTLDNASDGSTLNNINHSQGVPDSRVQTLALVEQ